MSFRITQQHNYAAVDVWDGSRWVASFASESDAKAFIATQDLLSACQELVRGIETWNAEVSKIVDCSHLPKWAGLEQAKAAIAKVLTKER